MNIKLDLLLTTLGSMSLISPHRTCIVPVFCTHAHPLYHSHGRIVPNSLFFLLPSYCDSTPSNYNQLINPPFFSSISILLQLLLLDLTSRPSTRFLLSLPSLFLHCFIHFHLCHSSPCQNPLTAFCFNFATLPSLIHLSSFFALHSCPFSSLMYSSIYCLWFIGSFSQNSNFINRYWLHLAVLLQISDFSMIWCCLSESL